MRVNELEHTRRHPSGDGQCSTGWSSEPGNERMMELWMDDVKESPAKLKWEL